MRSYLASIGEIAFAASFGRFTTGSAGYAI
jgi:hypothetical protein